MHRLQIARIADMRFGVVLKKKHDQEDIRDPKQSTQHYQYCVCHWPLANQNVTL